jgi:hypothetical protein
MVLELGFDGLAGFYAWAAIHSEDFLEQNKNIVNANCLFTSDDKLLE